MGNKNVRNICITALLTALTALCTAYISVPMPSSAGYVHFGDAIIMISACLLDFPYALFVGALGGAVADLITGFAVYAPYTIVIKLLLAFCYSSKKEKIVNTRNIIGFAPSIVITVGGYYLAEVMISGNWISPIAATVPGNLIQSIGSIVVFIVLGIAMDKLNFKKNILKLKDK